jgi:putative DNA primase/helicase
VRIAYLLSALYEGELLHAHGIGWFWWDGMRWAPDDTGRARRAVLDVLKAALAASLHDKALRRDVTKCESDAGIAGVLGIAKVLPAFTAAARDLDADPYLLNHAGGTLDLRTLETHPHSPADRLTKVCRGAYRPDASSPLWEAFLARVLPDPDVRAFLWRYVGVGLVGRVIEHKLLIGTGTGANGKSVFDGAIRFALGDYAITAEPDLFMHRENAHPTGEMDLRGVRWVSVSESERDRRLAETSVKRLTGGDAIRARRMRQDFVEFDPSHTAMLITNHLPKVSGDDPAIWRRLRVTPFDVVIPEADQDGQLGAQLELAADAILTMAVGGYRDYVRRGGLAEPATVLRATDDYQRSSDAVRRFIDEMCTTTSPALKATTADLFTVWERWRHADGAESMTSRAFGIALDRQGYPADGPTNGKRWRPGIAAKVVTDDE